MNDYLKDIIYLFKMSVYTDVVITSFLALYGKLDTSYAYGILIGIILVLFNFIVMVKTSIVGLSKPPNTAKMYILVSYFLRLIFISVFVCLSFIISGINHWILIVHLFYPKIFFFLKIIIRKEG